MSRSPCLKWAAAVVLLLVLLAADGPAQVSAAPQAVVMGRRPAAQPEPIVIDNEEAMGKPMDEVVDPLAPEPDVDPMIGWRAAPDGGGHPPDNSKPVAEAPEASKGMAKKVEEKAHDLKWYNAKITELRGVINGKTADEVTKEGLDKQLATLEAERDQLMGDLVTELNSLVGSTTPSSAAAKDADSESGLPWWIIALVLVLVLILLAVLIWAIIRHRKKKALRAQGLNAEVTSVTPVITPDGQQANVVHIEPLSAPTTGTPTAGA